MSEVVGGADNKGVEGVFIIAVDVFFGLNRNGRVRFHLVGGLQNDVEFILENRLKRLVQKRQIAAVDGLAVKVGGDNQVVMIS